MNRWLRSPYKQILEFAMLVMLILGLPGCMALQPAAQPVMAFRDVIGVYPGQVAHGIKMVLEQKPGGDLLQMGRWYLFAWPLNNGYAFVGLDITTGDFMKSVNQVLNGGNYVSASDMRGFVNDLIKCGWARVGVKALPEGYASWVQIGGLAEWVTSVSSSLVTFVLLPAGEEPIWLDIVGVDTEDY